MRNRRVLIIVGLIVVVGGVLIGALLLRGRIGGTAEAPVPTATPTPAMASVVVAVQNIGRGQLITQDMNAIQLRPWPVEALPIGVVTTESTVYGSIARVDIPRGMPITESMLAEEAGQVVGLGSEAAMQIPEGRVAYALPVSRYSSVAWAIRPGDRVDVMMSLLMVDLDEEYQTILPNEIRVPCEDETGCTYLTMPMGRMEILPTGEVVTLLPSEDQRPRLVTQLTVQNALVLHVGDWPLETTTPVTPTETTGEEAQAEATPTPEPTEQALTLAVSPQDAAVLEYAMLSNARVTLVLRRAGDTDPIATTPVTLQYVLETYGIEVPTRLPYGMYSPVLTTVPAE